MNRAASVSLLALALAVGTAAAVSSAVPSAANSSLPPCMVFCPIGDAPYINIPAFTVVVRDIANNVIPGSTVVLDFSGCPQAYICPQIPLDPYTVNPTTRTLSRVTDASGSVTFPARVGGTGPAGCAKVFADGVLLKTYALASFDQDGNGQVVSVIGNDDPIFASKLGTVDPTADFDCSGGVVDAQDEFLFSFHHSHSCLGIVDPVKRSSWGGLKSHYR